MTVSGSTFEALVVGLLSSPWSEQLTDRGSPALVRGIGSSINHRRHHCRTACSGAQGVGLTSLS